MTGMNRSPSPPVLTAAMAAALLPVHVEHLRRMVRAGRVPSHRLPGGRELRFFRDELVAWLQAQPAAETARVQSGEAVTQTNVSSAT